MCRKSVAKLEIIRPRLEESYNVAIETVKTALEDAERLMNKRLALQEETERLQRLKNEQDKIHASSFTKSALETESKISLDDLENKSNDTLPTNEVNSKLKSFQDRMGISHLDHDHNQHSVPQELPVSAPTPKFFSEGGMALRPVHVPQCLISTFLQLAAKNTQGNLETCGVLAGKLQHNVFTITCLIIPKQVATSDTCAMINEEEIITAQDSLDVMSLGWIHVKNNKNRC